MGKLGTSGNPIRIRVTNEKRMEEVVGICEKNNWIYICGIEPEHPEDISELEYMLNPKSFGVKRPKMKQVDNVVFIACSLLLSTSQNDCIWTHSFCTR